MKQVDIVREIILDSLIGEKIRTSNIYQYAQEKQIPLSPKQCRTGLESLCRNGAIKHVKQIPQKESYFLATSKIGERSNTELPKFIQAKPLPVGKQPIYKNKYLQLLGDFDLINYQHGNKRKGFNSLSGHITRARPRVYVGCSMEMV